MVPRINLNSWVCRNFSKHVPAWKVISRTQENEAEYCCIYSAMNRVEMYKLWFMKEIRGWEFHYTTNDEPWADNLQKMHTSLSQGENSNGKQFHTSYMPL